MGNNIGISAIGLSLPPLALSHNELAKLNNVQAGKYLTGLGCQSMALCPNDFGVVELAETAAHRALRNWSGRASDIGMVVVGTESGLDMSRPLSSWVMERLKLKGQIRAYEVKHACFAGTLAIRQAIEWQLSGNAKGKAALVIAADQGLYEPKHPAEPTQGSGAAAFIIDSNACIAKIEPISYAWSSPEYDFWRPVGNAYPNINGKLSVECYKTALFACFKYLLDDTGSTLQTIFNNIAYFCFHVPFPKLVNKAFISLCEQHGLKTEEIQKLYKEKVQPTMDWNVNIGNCYTSSLWFAVANAFTKMEKNQQLLAFSYGSGSGAELLTITAVTNNTNPLYQQQLATDFSKRTYISADEYLNLRTIKKERYITETF